jgi:hypothetical protein
MCGTAVRYEPSTGIRPRESAVSPAAARSSAPVAPCRPAEYITVSAGIRLPLSSVVTVPRSLDSTLATVSPNLNDTDRSRRWNFNASTTSESQKSSIRSRCSTTVTRVPRAANIEAYSIPITPAPTTTIDRGMARSERIPSESMIRSSSKSTLAGRAGWVPVAITILAPVTRRSLSPSPATVTVCGSRNRAVPGIRSTPLRNSWLRTTSVSRPITCWVRPSRSMTVMSSLTR